MPLRSKSKKADKTYPLKIKLLDNTILNVDLPLKARGGECLQRAAKSLGLEEINYFGLQYINKRQQLRWIETDRCLKKQLDHHAFQGGKDVVLFFKVQFYVTNCQRLNQEITRYLYYLQLKSNVTEGVLSCKLDTAIKLAALAVQGDSSKAFIRPFESEGPCASSKVPYPDWLKSLKRNVHGILDRNGLFRLDSIVEISLLHQKNRGMSPAAAEMAYIGECQQLDGYGVEHYLARDKDGTDLMIGPSHIGIQVKHTNGLPTVYFMWQDISNMAFHRHYFCVESGRAKETVQFETVDVETAKYIWRMCVSQHQFHRLQHSTIQSPGFRTQHEILTDTALISKCQEEQPFKRRLTLTRNEAKEVRRARTEPTERAETPSGMGFAGICNAAFDDFDNEEDDRRAGSPGIVSWQSHHDMAAANGEQLNGGINPSSVRSTASSGYKSSNSDTETDSGNLRNHPVADYPLNSTMLQASPDLYKVKRQRSETRDQLLKQLERIVEDDQVQTEYEQIFAKKLNCNVNTASLVLNAQRNRNKEVLPYEENRIVLDASKNRSNNDYVNASYLKIDVGKSKVLSFIGAQAPLESTVEDFWQMIWEQNVLLLVMVTREEESGKSKSFRYWSDDEQQSQITYGLFSVGVHFITSSNSFITRGLKVTHLTSGEDRTIFQVQYTGWPDSGVPENVNDFVEYLEEVRSMQTSVKELEEVSVSEPKTLVHCSDGAGRTGVFILCETLIAMIENNLMDVAEMPHLLALETDSVQKR